MNFIIVFLPAIWQEVVNQAGYLPMRIMDILYAVIKSTRIQHSPVNEMAFPTRKQALVLESSQHSGSCGGRCGWVMLVSVSVSGFLPDGVI